MSDPSPFADFIRRIRAGDGLAAEELVRRLRSLSSAARSGSGSTTDSAAS